MASAVFLHVQLMCIVDQIMLLLWQLQGSNYEDYVLQKSERLENTDAAQLFFMVRRAQSTVVNIK